MIVAAGLSGCTSPTPTAAPTAAPSATPSPAPQTLVLSTTTSMRDSGLLDVLLPAFEQANNAHVDVHAQGSGAALAMGQSGDADVLIVHSPAAETTFMNAGYGWNRTLFAHNWFVIVGPASDPAGIKNMTNATLAFKRIYDNKSTFVGRGDNSGTATKELALWNGTGYTAPDNKSMSSWYQSTGQGMLQTLQIANQMGGYTLSDKSTFLQNQKNLTGLTILVDATPDMINKYDVIEVNATLHPNVNYALAHKFLQFMISPETQVKISNYGKDTVGQALFVADVLNQTT
ncbi:MAG TPA: substrate-binding domain-containing protein [Methanocella sp.]|nr:substrate-binding domain-containing protein [Methanocella sp.]